MPVFDTSYITRYLFDGGEFLILDYGLFSKLSAAYNKGNIDLLSDGYIARVADFSVLIDGEEPLTSNPIVTINYRTYIPIDDLAEQLGIEVKWNEGKLEILKK